MGFKCSEVLRIFKNFIRLFQRHKTLHDFKQEYKFKSHLMKTKEFFRIRMLKNSIDVCMVCTVHKILFKSVDLFRLPKKT